MGDGSASTPRGTMNILVCESSGCIGSAVTRNLRWRGHRVVESTRRADAARPEAMTLDFAEQVSPMQWAERLRAARIDVVVNCVGVLMPAPGCTFEQAHTEGPIALFRGAVMAGASRVIQVSALGVGKASPGKGEPAYLRSKRLADEALMALDIDAAVLRPSLVYGPRSQSGAMFATLASLPVIGLPGPGAQRMQPIHVYELAESVATLVERTGCARGIYEIGGSEVVSYREMLGRYRDALGLGEAIWLPIPVALMRAGALLAERLPQKVFSRDTVRLLEQGSVTSCNAAPVLLGRTPSTLAAGLATTAPTPAFDLGVRLGLPMERVLRGSLAFLWIAIAVISAALPERSGVLDLLARCGFTGDAGRWALALSCALNLGLGLWTLAKPGVHLYALQAVAITGYTVTAAIGVPGLLIDHCGPLVKNAPVLMLVVALWLAEAGQARPARRARREHGRAQSPSSASLAAWRYLSFGGQGRSRHGGSKLNDDRARPGGNAPLPAPWVQS